MLNLRVELFTHLQRLSLGFFERRQLGDMMSRLGGDVSDDRDAGPDRREHGADLCLPDPVLHRDAVLPRLAARARRARRRARVPARRRGAVASASSVRRAELRRRSGSISAVAEESLSNLALVQAYDRQTDETARYRRENQGAFSAQMVATRLEALFGPFSDLVEVIGVLLVMGFAIWELADGRITLGGLLVFVAYLSQLYGPVAGFGGLWNEMSSAKAGAERIIEMLDEEAGGRRPGRPHAARPAAGALRLQQVTFTYPDTERPALIGHRPADLARGEGRRGRGQRGGQDDADQAAAALLRPRRRPRHPRRPRPARPEPVRPAPQRRRRAAGDPRLRRHDRRQHPLGTARTPRTHDDRARRAAPRTSTGSCRTCPTGTPRGWASAAGCCPAGSGSGSPSRAR